MKAIIYHTLSKAQNSKRIALEIEGDHFEITGTNKIITFVPFQMIYYGYMTVASRIVELEKLDIDFDKYDEVVLVSPVWAGQVNAYMRQFLKENSFTNKKVTLIGSCSGGYKRYFKSFKGLIDDSNEIIERIMYVKGEKE